MLIRRVMQLRLVGVKKLEDFVVLEIEIVLASCRGLEEKC